MTTVQLRAGDLELVVGPERGGAILAFRRQGFDLMRPWDGSNNPRNRASNPLVPFSGRVDHACFPFDRNAYTLEANAQPSPHAIHGDGWLAVWRPVEADAARAVLDFVHDDPSAALRYRAQQTYVLTPDRLEITLAITNVGDRPMPFGLGHHPYFTHRAEALLSAEVEGVWIADDTNIPRRLEPVPAAWDFRERRRVAELTLDNNFQGWSGQARIDWPESGKALGIEASEIFRHLVVYVPEGRDFFCVEPVSHVADGFNLMAAGVPDTGVRVLAPGETLSGWIRFTPEESMAGADI